ncbi:MAG: exodeoxyribonuclease VII large subunit [Eubacteriales bacterium]
MDESKEEVKADGDTYSAYMGTHESDEETDAAAASDERRIFSVTQLSNFLRDIISCTPQLGDVYISGEISNYKNNYKTGHLYFTLKDDTSVIRAVMFKGNASKLRFTPENGMSVIAHGNIAMFVRDGQHMLYAGSLEPLGVGSLYFAFEQLKAKLNGEGLFRADIKKPLPRLPQRIGMVTSPTGAAVRDMINIFARRFKCASLVIFPALVQGDGAAAQIIEGIRYFNAKSRCDVIIIGRGGGSMEDLWAFNDEALARAIRESRIPVISAVGHEIDFTISDFAADRRAPTPSAAAELAVPDGDEIKNALEVSQKRLSRAMTARLRLLRERLARSEASHILRNPSELTDERRMILDSGENRLVSSFKSEIAAKSYKWRENSSKLEALSPLAILKRGYGAVFSGERLIRSVDEAEAGEDVKIKLSDGTLYASITSKDKNPTF